VRRIPSRWRAAPMEDPRRRHPATIRIPQAQATLQESEERIGDGARAPTPSPEPPEDQLEEKGAD
jgi:hypothetical protein